MNKANLDYLESRIVSGFSQFGGASVGSSGGNYKGTADKPRKYSGDADNAPKNDEGASSANAAGTKYAAGSSMADRSNASAAFKDAAAYHENAAKDYTAAAAAHAGDPAQQSLDLAAAQAHSDAADANKSASLHMPSDQSTSDSRASKSSDAKDASDAAKTSGSGAQTGWAAYNAAHYGS